MESSIRKFRKGEKVEVNGNKDARIVRYYSEGMVECRLWSGTRCVGVVCVPECDIKSLEPSQ